MSARPWMPLYIGDYQADTRHLSAVQHGGYLLLIMHYWQRGGLPDDDSQLARIACMAPSEWRRHRPVIRSFFGDGWRHARIEQEIAEAEEAYERRAKAGRAGGKARAERKQCSSNATISAQAMLKQSQPQSQDLRSIPIQGEQSSGDVEGYQGGTGPFTVMAGGRG